MSLSLKKIALYLGTKVPFKTPFLRNSVQPIVNVVDFVEDYVFTNNLQVAATGLVVLYTVPEGYTLDLKNVRLSTDGTMTWNQVYITLSGNNCYLMQDTTGVARYVLTLPQIIRLKAGDAIGVYVDTHSVAGKIYINATGTQRRII